MKKSVYSRSIALLLCVFLVMGVLSLPAFAVEIDEDQLNYYQVTSKKDWQLAPGITESEIVMNTASGNKRQVSHVVEIDIHNPYTKVIPSTYKMAEGLENKEYRTQVMSQQAKYAEEHGYGNVVAAMNTALNWYDTDYYNQHPELIGEPLGTLIMDGAVYTNSQGPTWGAALCLVINFDEKNGEERPSRIPKTEMRWTNSPITGWEEQLIPIQFYPLVVDGVNQHVINDPTEPAPRSFIGIKEDGTIITVMNEGRQAPYSTGFNCYEMAEFMISLGCVWAANCDGGGSSTFLSQRPGEELELHCSPSDGSERATTHGVLVISTAPASGEFAKATISAEGDYYTPGSTVRFVAKGYDPDGAPADMPFNAVWQLADASFGTLSGGIFVSNGKCGEVTVQLIVDGIIVGQDTISVVKPETLSFVSETIAVPFGSRTKLALNATYNGNQVILQDSDAVFSLSNPGIGSIEGMYFTAANADTSCTGTVVTATVCGISATAEISLGKGSKLIYSFENLGDDDPLNCWALQCTGGNARGDISLVNRSAGKVRNGDFSLAVACDYTQVNELGSHTLELTFPNIDCTGATRIGFWIYVPYEARYSYLDFGKGCGEECRLACIHNYNFCGIREDGWIYVTSEVGADTENSIRFSIDDRDSAEYNASEQANLNGKFTFYIDDITLDYSDAVSDRSAPYFPYVAIVNSATGEGSDYPLLHNGQTIDFNTVSFEATVADSTAAANASGIDEKSVKVWVDGVRVDHKYHNEKITVSGLTLADGFHSVKFEVADLAGNVGSLISDVFRVQSGVDASSVKLMPRTPDADRLPIGSLYWMDVAATDLETIDQVKMVFDLNGASSWAFEGMTIAEGFKATHVIEQSDNSASIIIERTSDITATGETVLASIPVRTWVCESEKTPADLVRNHELWAQSIEITLKTGEITYVDGYKSPALNGFGMEKILVDTELFFNGQWVNDFDEAREWGDACVSAGVGFHEHTPATLVYRAPTCSETGYTDRVFCEVCNSVVEWGKTVPAVGHTFEIAGNKIACDCGRVSNVTGLQDVNGKRYYAVNGNLTGGWVGIDDDWYYFDKTTFAGVDGVYTTEDNVRFTFDQGRLTQGVWTRNSEGRRYWYGPGYYRDSSTDAGSSRPYEIDGKTYLFNRNGYMQTGVVYSYDNATGAIKYYDCGTDGISKLLTGFYNEYFYKDGVMQKAYQLVEYEGDFYFINDYHKPFKNGTIELGERFTSKFDLPAGRYAFDAEGKMVINHGVVGDYLYIDGVLQKSYQLIELEGSYYFVSDYNKVFKNSSIELGARFTSQYGLPAGRYAFDAQGKMVINHGVVGDHLYIDGVLQKAYQLIEFEGNYYFVNDYNKLLKNATVSLGANFTSPYGIPAGRYAFDAEGKMIINHGVVEDQLYINGVLQKAYQLIEFEGSYYFVSDYNKVFKNSTIELGTRFTSQYDLPAGRYAFDAEGKMIINHGVVGDQLYINGVLQKAYQLIEFEDNYYFVNDYNKLLKNATISLSERFTSPYGIPAGRYAFDAEGKMIINHGVAGDQLYINGVLQKAYQLVEFEGSYYFVNDYNKILKNATIDLGASFTSRYDLPAGRYQFDGEGKMIINHGIVGDYLYINGQLQKCYQLIEFEGDYYFINDYNKLLKNKRIYLSERFISGITLEDGSMLEVGYFSFDANGKLILK